MSQGQADSECASKNGVHRGSVLECKDEDYKQFLIALLDPVDRRLANQPKSFLATVLASYARVRDCAELSVQLEDAYLSGPMLYLLLSKPSGYGTIRTRAVLWGTPEECFASLARPEAESPATTEIAVPDGAAASAAA